MSIEDLPEEMRRHVLDYCSDEDLKNFALCSKLCASIVRPIWWQSVTIDLSNYKVDYLQYLKYTVELHLSEADGGAGQQTGIFLSEILSFCQPTRINSLIMNGFSSDVTICYVLGVLNQVKSLVLTMATYDERTLDWTQITNVLPPLNDLEMDVYHIHQSPRGTDLEIILDKLELQGLSVDVFDERSLIRISKEQQLQRLQILVLNDFTNDISCLGELCNLHQLGLHGNRVSEQSMNQLYRNLQKLQYLTLDIGDGFSDAHIRELHKLSSLKHLDIVNKDSQLTAHSFEHIGSIKTLRSLQFQAYICNEEGLDKVTCLNQIPTLEKITVEDYESTPSKTLEMIKYLTKDKVWKLSNEQESSYTIYTLMI